MGKNKNKKRNKQKTVYVDNGATISNMSNVRSGFFSQRKAPAPYRAPLKEQWATYLSAVRMMFVPMLVMLGIIALAFLIVYILL